MFAKVLPLLSLAAALFGILFLYIGWHSFAGGAPGWGVVIGVFGLIGVVLAVLLWRAGAKLGGNGRRPPGG